MALTMHYRFEMDRFPWYERGVCLVSILSLLILFSTSWRPVLGFFIPHDEMLKCYCCLDGDSHASLKCGCGCSDDNETDTSRLFSDLVTSRFDFILGLAPGFGPTDAPLPPGSVRLDVPTRPPANV